jgi:hypothetical protein
MTQADLYRTLPEEVQHSALLQLLSNPLILYHTAPYMAVSDVVSLAATSRAFRYLIYETPRVFRRLDLTSVKMAQFDIVSIDRGGETWRNAQMDENLTEEECVVLLRPPLYSRSPCLPSLILVASDGVSALASTPGPCAVSSPACAAPISSPTSRS